MILAKINILCISTVSKCLEYLRSYGIWWKSGAYKIYACKQLLYLLLIVSWVKSQGKKNNNHCSNLMLTLFSLPSTGSLQNI